MFHQIIKRITFSCIFALFCIIYSGCNLVSDKGTYQIATIDNNQKNEKTMEHSENTSVDKETENLLKLNKDISNSGSSSDERFDKTNTFVDELYQYLNTRSNLKCLAQISRLEVLESNYQGSYIFNLVRYDADPVGIGTLERTWSLLQIVSENDIDVYSVYDKSAEFPLFFKIKDAPLKNGQIIAIAGVTNMSRSNSTFISFWIYNGDSLEKFTDISLTSDYDGGMLFENEYFLEYYGNNAMKINDNEEDYGIYDIIADDFELRSTYKDGQINIAFTELH